MTATTIIKKSTSTTAQHAVDMQCIATSHLCCRHGTGCLPQQS
jgi:hypothetical protein